MTPASIVSRPVNDTVAPAEPALTQLERKVQAELDLRARAPFGTAGDRDAELGQLLIDVCREVGRGHWLEWLKAHGIEPRSAQRYVRVALNPELRQRREISARLRWRVWERDDFRCHYCGVRQFLETDHKVPVHRGGTDDIENIVTACQSCNRRKGTTSYEAFLIEIGGPAACTR